MNKQLISLCMALLVTVALSQANPLYWYHYSADFSRSHSLSQYIADRELNKAGFKITSDRRAWERVGSNADTVVVVTNAPLSPSKTYVHVIAMSDMDAPAKKWAAQIMEAIKNSKAVSID